MGANEPDRDAKMRLRGYTSTQLREFRRHPFESL